jgi:hypothetical protein
MWLFFLLCFQSDKVAEKESKRSEEISKAQEKAQSK